MGPLTTFRGRHVIGVYAMLDDDRCWFLAADFDLESWADDVAAVSHAVRRRARSWRTTPGSIAIRCRRGRRHDNPGKLTEPDPFPSPFAKRAFMAPMSRRER
jgi:hypothetical protein